MSIEQTERERIAGDLIVETMGAIMEMDERPGHKLAYNGEELGEAIHVLQGFWKQHILHRLDPDLFSDWWTLDGTDKA